MPSVKPRAPGCCCFVPKRKEDEPKPLNQRGCTDFLCLIIFIAFFGAFVAVFIYAAVSGDWNHYFYGTDYLGNRCGQGEFSNRSKAFYPRIELDLREQSDKVYTSPWAIELYALCVASCPSVFEISNPVQINDYGYVPGSPTTEALGEGTQASWISVLPTVDLVNRCVPRAEVGQNSHELCAYPQCGSSALAGMGVTCDSQYPAEWRVCGGSVTAQQCTAQKGACEVLSTHITGVSYTTYTTEEAGGGNALVVLADTVGGFYKVAKTLADAYGYIIVGGIVLPVMAAFIFMLLLRFFAKIIVYLLLVALVCFMVSITLICYVRSDLNLGGVNAANFIAEASQNVTLTNPTLVGLTSAQENDKWMWVVGFFIMCLLTVFVIISILLARKKIKVAISIVVEATKVFTAMPSLMISPTWAVLAQAGVSVWCLAAVALMLTTKPETMMGALDRIPDSGSGNYERAESGLGRLRQLQSDEATTLLVGFVLFAYLWLTQFVAAVAWTAMSGAVCHWFFFRTDKKEATRVPIIRSLGRVFRFHLGSMAFGSLVIALAQFLQWVLAYVERHLNQGNSFVIRMVFKCCMCCLWCLEKSIKFITYYGFVFVALRGDNFCSSCFMTFKFIVANPMQAAMNSLVTRLLTLCCYFTIPVGCAIGTYIYIEQRTDIVDAIYPSAAVVILSAFVTQACMGVFECVVTTIFVCCFRDAELYGGKYMSASMRSALEIGAPDPKAYDSGAKEGGADDGGGGAYTQKV